MSVEVEVLGTKFARVAGELRGSSPRLRRRMGVSIRAAANPVKEALAQAAMGLSSEASVSSRRGWAKVAHGLRWTSRKLSTKGGRWGGFRSSGGGLRTKIAGSLQIQVKSAGASPSILIRANPGKMPARMKSLPAATDKGRWRHPVMGNRRVWATQTASPPGWFTVTGPQHFPEVQHAISDAIDAFVADEASRLH